MTNGNRRHLPWSFKRQAVERLATSGMPTFRVAAELGLHETARRRRIARRDPPDMGLARRPATPAQGPSPADPAAENARLKRELQRAQMECDMPQRKPRASSGYCPPRRRVDDRDQRRMGRRARLYGAGVTGPHHRSHQAMLPAVAS